LASEPHVGARLPRTWRPTRAPEIGTRTEPFVESVIREMTRLGAETNAINLSQGVPDFSSPPEVVEAALAAIRGESNQYTFSFGLPEFRTAIASRAAHYNGIQADPQTEVTVTCGVSEAIVSAMIGLLDPGDEVIILEPWFEIYIPDCIIAGAVPRYVPLREPDYAFDPTELRAAFNERTRMILINTPHNPTGRLFTRAELTTIAELCQEFNVIAVADEIYENIYFGDREHVSIGSLEGMGDRTVTISGLGKSYSVTGWRVGWAIADERLTTPIRRVHDYLTVCAPHPFQVAGAVALGLPDSYYEAMRAEFATRRDVLVQGIRDAGMTCMEPQGAYYVMADFAGVDWPSERHARPDWTPDRAFAEYMAREVGVAVVPGSSFYEGRRLGHTRLRFNFAKREETLAEAARRMRGIGRRA